MEMPLIVGNSKLGSNTIWQWGLPAVATCPGRSADCERACYATKGRYRFATVKNRLVANELDRHSDDWAERVAGQIAAGRIYTVRIHTSGDFDTVEYVEKWIAIAKARPRTRFYAYTRSWSVSRLRSALRKLGALPNVQLWLSYDKSMGKPPRWAGTRVAFMSSADEEAPNGAADMVFRVNRKTKANRIGGIVVCPRERSKQSTKVTCESCRVCIDRTNWIDQANGRPRALPVLA